MLLFAEFDIRMSHIELTHSNFSSCRGLITYLNRRGFFDSFDLNDNKSVIKESLCSDLEINLFTAYFVFDEFPHSTKRQTYLSELIVHLFFRNGLDLMKQSEVNKFFEIAAMYFPSCFPLYNRKLLGSLIRKSTKLIPYKQGGYVLQADVESFWKKEEIKRIQEDLRKELKDVSEVDPVSFFKKHEHELESSRIYNSHYMFSALKAMNNDDDIIYYRNTFNSKIRRKTE